MTNTTNEHLPRRLRAGDTVSLISASGAIPDRERLEAAESALESLGLKVKRGKTCEARYGYLGGDDELRASDLGAALADGETRAVLFAKGGYGSTRILDRIDWSALARQPKILAGYSDVTGIHLAAARVGVPSFHSPMASSDFATELSPWTAAEFLRTLGSTEPLGPVALPPDAPEPYALAEGVATGPLLGGNLSLLAATMGTPFQLDPRGAILFIEDVDEEPYRIDRMLTQLRLSGFFEACAGVILGDWKDCEAPPGKPSLSLAEVFADVIVRDMKGSGKPVLAGFAAGHRRPTAMFPLGVRSELDTKKGQLSLIEAALRDV